MKLALPILCVLLGLAAAEPPPPSYMFSNYDETSQFGASEGDAAGISELGQESSRVGFQSPFGGGGEGGFGNENEVQGYQSQGDDYGFDAGPSNSFEGGGGGLGSYSPPSGDHDSYGPPTFGGPKKRPYSGFSMFLPRMPKIRINLGRPKMPQASPSHFAYPTYAQSGPGPQQSSPFESHSGPGSEMSSFDTSPKGPHGLSYEEAPTSAYGAPSKGPHSSYEIPITYEKPSKPGYSGPSHSSQYGGRPKDIPSYKPSNSYGSAPLGLKLSGYKNTPSSQYRPFSGGPGGYKKPYSSAYKQQAPDFDRPYENPKGGHSSPALSSAGGYVRGPSYTKYMPPIKSHTHTSKPMPMNTYGGSDYSHGSFDAPLKSYGPPANDYLDPVSNYNAPIHGSSYQGPGGSNSYDDFDDQENRYKRRPQSYNHSHGRPPMSSSPHSYSSKPPPSGRGYPAPSSAGGYKPNSHSQSSPSSYDNYSNFGSSPEPEYSPHSSPYAGSSMFRY